MFGLIDEQIKKFDSTLQKYTESEIDLMRNKAAVQNFYDLSTALALFTLIYLGFTVSNLSLERLSLFLFAMFRLSPIVSRLNGNIYNLEGNLSHLVRTQRFIDELQSQAESDGSRPIDKINRISFNGVEFAYDEVPVFQEISFKIL
jgi:subfamily B ATP-binding cassette protein MsbA